MKSIYLTYRLFVVLGVIVTLFAISFWLQFLFYIAIIALGLLGIIIIYEYAKLHKISGDIKAYRSVRERLSLGDEQQIDYTIHNKTSNEIDITLLDDLPYQFQEREPIGNVRLGAHSKTVQKYFFRPTIRGEYKFGNIQLLISLPTIGLIQYKLVREEKQMSMVFPSIIQMKKFALQIFSRTASMYGIRRVRTIGENDEFEHIRPFYQGDNIKSINWKATSRKGELVVNQYQDSRSQMIYCLIDKGRSMEMPFNGLSLLDYSINSALVISNIVLSKYDKAGIVTFSKEIDSYLPADAHTKQLEKVLKLLYNQKTDFSESGFEQLYFSFRRRVSRRSIVFLFTNFESEHDLARNIKYLKALSQRHLLIVICFENAELANLGNSEVTTVTDIYDNTIAHSYQYEKEKIIKDLKLHGIQTIYTRPEDLSINVINKYLEIKAKRMK